MRCDCLADGPFFCEDNVYRGSYAFTNSTEKSAREADPTPVRPAPRFFGKRARWHLFDTCL